MIYNIFQDLELSALGFGAMRLPLLPDKSIDRDAVFRMVDYAIAHGINYFDTALPYHDGNSETVLGDALARHPRESWLLADKFPGHQHSRSFDPAGVFRRGLFVDAQVHQQLTEQRVPLVDPFGLAFALLGEFEITVLVDSDISVFFEQSDRAADGRFRVAHIRSDVNTPDRRRFLGQYVYGLKVHFS